MFYDFITKYTEFFFLKKWQKLLQCKSFLHFFNKNIGVFEILTFDILKKTPLTNDVVSFEQLGPGLRCLSR